MTGKTIRFSEEKRETPIFLERTTTKKPHIKTTFFSTFGFFVFLLFLMSVGASMLSKNKLSVEHLYQYQTIEEWSDSLENNKIQQYKCFIKECPEKDYRKLLESLLNAVIIRPLRKYTYSAVLNDIIKNPSFYVILQSLYYDKRYASAFEFLNGCLRLNTQISKYTDYFRNGVYEAIYNDDVAVLSKLPVHDIRNASFRNISKYNIFLNNCPSPLHLALFLQAKNCFDLFFLFHLYFFISVLI